MNTQTIDLSNSVDVKQNALKMNISEEELRKLVLAFGNKIRTIKMMLN